MKLHSFLIILLSLLLFSCSNANNSVQVAEDLMIENPERATHVLERILAEDMTDKMDGHKARATMLMAKVKLLNCESFLTIENFDDALNYYEATQDTSALLDMYQYAAIKMRWLSDQDSAANYLIKAIDIASSSTDPTKSELLIELSNLYAKPSLKKDYPKALTYAIDAMKVAHTNKEKARALHDIGLFYSYIGQNDSASIYIERALSEIDVNDPQFTTYALNYASLPSADFKISVTNLNRIDAQSLGKLITLGYIYINQSQIDSARHYVVAAESLYNENPGLYSINTYNVLRLLGQSVRLIEKGTVDFSEATVTNDSISEVTAIQRKISDERQDYNNKLQIQLLQTKAHRQFLVSLGLGIFLFLILGFGIYVWHSKRKFLKLKQRLDNVKVEQIFTEASDENAANTIGLVHKRMEICIEQFRESKIQAYLDKMEMKYRNDRTYPSLKDREEIQKNLIGCFADFIVDLKMTGVRLNMDDLVTCIMSCLRESNTNIAACLGATETAIRTRKSRLRTKLPTEMLKLLNL